MVVWLIGLRAWLCWAIFPNHVPEVYTDYSVEIAWFPKDSLANEISTIWYNWGWLDMVTTMIGENWWFNKDIVSITNDHWLCQLNYRWHKDFIESEDFRDPFIQANYCLWVRNDAIKKHRLSTTFYAYNHRNIYKKRVTVIEKKYYKLFNMKFYMKDK